MMCEEPEAVEGRRLLPAAEHAATTADGRDRKQLERICRYLLRPPFAHDGGAPLRSPQLHGALRGLLGTLTQGFVDRLAEGVSCFLLGGRAWLVLRIAHDNRRIVVEPAPRGKRPTWGGFIPSFLGFHLCQKIGEVLTSEQTYAYLNPEAAAILTEQRRGMDGITIDPRQHASPRAHGDRGGMEDRTG